MPWKMRRTFQLWAKTDEYKARVAESKELIRKTLATHHCAVAYSGGKDSTVMLHLVLQEKPDVDVFHWDHGSWLMPREIEKEILENTLILGAKNLVVKGSKQLEKEEARTNWRIWYLVFWNTLARTRKDKGWEKQFIGLRREEGCRRRGKIDQGGYGEVYPVADWKWQDIWAYIISNELPYPQVYDKYAKLLGYDQVRLVTFFDAEFEKFGSPYVDGFLLPGLRHQERE